VLKVIKWFLFAAFCLLLMDQAVQWTELSDGWLQSRRVIPFDPPLFNNDQRTSLLRIEAVGDDEVNRSIVGRIDAELGWAPVPGGRDVWGSYDQAGARTDGSPPDAPVGARAASGAGAGPGGGATDGARDGTDGGTDGAGTDGVAPSPAAPAAAPAGAPVSAAAGAATRPGDGTPLRVVAVGCSFTFGQGVGDDQTWAAQLERLRPDLEVVNLGVVGYGLDQALLRLWRDGMPLRPDEVWLGWRPGATLRMTTLYPPALTHGTTTVSFKPRYTLDGDVPRLVPNPVGSPADVMRLLSDQQAFLAAVGRDDLWVRRRPEAWAPFGGHWTHRFALSRLVVTALELEDREPEKWVNDRTTEANRLLRTLVQDGAGRVASAGARFRLLVLPDRRDLHWRNATSTLGYWADPVVMMAGRGVEVLDMSGALESAGALTDGSLWTDGHYGPRLNAAVAEVLAQRITGAPPEAGVR
jgi:hypothetical protein